MAKKNEESFEIQVKKLEGIVNALDEGTATLDEMLAMYEEGMKLAASCRQKLEEAEQKLTVLEKK